MFQKPITRNLKPKTWNLKPQTQSQPQPQNPTILTQSTLQITFIFLKYYMKSLDFMATKMESMDFIFFDP